jgi:hypothetical protein
METDMNEMIAKLNSMVDAVMLAYWGQPTPKAFAKAWNNACKILDQHNSSRRKPSYTKTWDALEWLVEATKDDEKVGRQLAA